MFEFLFCPQHGLLAPSNWPLIVHMAANLKPYLMFWRKA